eukprot:2742080-Pyramimonas_sp.AAC.1
MRSASSSNKTSSKSCAAAAFRASSPSMALASVISTVISIPEKIQRASLADACTLRPLRGYFSTVPNVEKPALAYVLNRLQHAFAEAEPSQRTQQPVWRDATEILLPVSASSITFPSRLDQACSMRRRTMNSASSVEHPCLKPNC